MASFLNMLRVRAKAFTLPLSAKDTTPQSDTMKAATTELKTEATIKKGLSHFFAQSLSLFIQRLTAAAFPFLKSLSAFFESALLRQYKVRRE